VSAADIARALPLGPGLSKLIVRPLMGLLGSDTINQLYRRLSGLDEPQSFIAGLLGVLNVDVTTTPNDLDRIPRKGPLIVMANHPTGALDGIALPSCFRAFGRM
jgi:putative hemolysin